MDKSNQTGEESGIKAASPKCSLPASLEVIGERWCFMILRAGFSGICHFEDFLSDIGIARNILANRLSRLVKADIMTRRPCGDDKRKVEYRLTEKGADLITTIVAMRQWGEKWETGLRSNPVLADAKDRRPIGRIAIQAHDGRALMLDDLCWIDEAELSDHTDKNRCDMTVMPLKNMAVTGK